jgi:lyso-ornithine lipid O-acyltransferase
LTEATARSAQPDALAGSPSFVRAICIALCYAATTLICLPGQIILLKAGRLRAAARFPVFYHRLCCKIIGLEVTTVGVPRGLSEDDRPALYICNHSSYLDIMVLGSLLPASFVAKHEVEGWPFFGYLARLQRTIFVNRAARHKTGEQRDQIADRLRDGGNVILFPEGTSSDGNRTLPFKTALFAAAATRLEDGKAVTVQPISVTATSLDGLPLGRAWRQLYAWYGDMELTGHMRRALQAGRIGVTVEFHPSVTMDDVHSRKAMADHCWRAVAGGVERAVTGRWASERA